jgi:hypothetical protein
MKLPARKGSQFYAHEELARDLKILLSMNPSVQEEHATWIETAKEIENRLRDFWDLDRSVFDYVRHFVKDGMFMSRDPDFYETESRKVRNCIHAFESDDRY